MPYKGTKNDENINYAPPLTLPSPTRGEGVIGAIF